MITIQLPTTIDEVPKSFSKKAGEFILDFTNVEGQWYVSRGDKLISDCVSDSQVIKDFAKSVIDKHYQ